MSLLRTTARLRRVATDELGYCRVLLSRPRKCLYVHRLVAQAFIPNPLGLRDVDHIDGNPTNNVVENLRWVSHKENLDAAIARRGNWLATCPRQTQPLIRIDPESGERVRYASTIGAVRACGLPDGCAGNVCHAAKTGRPAYGYLWRRGRRAKR